jgi:hypothetical protein
MSRALRIPVSLAVAACFAAPAAAHAGAACPVRAGGGQYEFGSAVAYVDDLDGDGFGDVAVGSVGTATRAGTVLIYRGGPEFDASADFVLRGPAPGDRFGAAVTGVGDVNADGFPDLAVGAPGDDVSGTADRGRVRVYFGGPAFDTVPDWIIDGPTAAGTDFGSAVAGGGDLNGDGRIDLAVGAPRADIGTTDAGAVYVYLGATPLPVGADRTFTGAPNELFGTSLAIATTFEFDPAADLAVGGPGYSNGNGRIHLFWGSSALDTSVDRTFVGLLGSHFGATLAAGDVNGDRYPDLIGGSFSIPRVYYQGPIGNSSPDLNLVANEPGSAVAGFVAAGFDLNGDGEPDFASSSTSHVYLYSGGPDADATPDAEWPLLSTSPVFGRTGAMGTDIDDDGLAELAVGSPDVGTVDLRLGACMNAWAAQTSYAAAPGTWFNARFTLGSCSSGVTFQRTVTDLLGWVEPQSDMLTLGPNQFVSFNVRVTMPWYACTQLNRVDVVLQEPGCAGSKIVASVFVPVTLCVPTDAGPTPGTAALPARTSLRSVSAAASGTLVRYDVAPATRSLRLEVFDVVGRRCRVLTNAVPAPGSHDVAWDHRGAGGVRVARGVYLVRLESDRGSDARKVVVATP